jgi:hypothetical protein
MIQTTVLCKGCSKKLMACSSTQQRRTFLHGKTPPRLDHLVPASEVTGGLTLLF